MDNSNFSQVLKLSVVGLLVFIPSCAGMFYGFSFASNQFERFSSNQALITFQTTELASIKMKEIEGKKSLAEAEWNKKIQIADANAKAEAAVSLAQVEIERAKGVAEANRIIGDSLKNNEGYLRYLWIQGLHHESNTTIYVPTEAGLPILEAGRGLSK